MKHNGSFETSEGGYGGEFALDDGTVVNVVTIITGPGMAADTEIEADRPLTSDEQDALLDEESCIDHADATQIEYTARQTQHRI